MPPLSGAAKWVHLNRMDRILEACVAVPQIHWELQAQCECNAFGHCLEVLNRHMPRYASFKFGHTHVPLQRWKRFQRDRQYPKRLSFVWVSEDVDETSKLEAELVEAFKHDSRCLNFREGGGYTDFGFSPFFVYIAFQ